MTSGAADEDLFRSEVWKRALERYSAATHLTVEVIGVDGEPLADPNPITPMFKLLGRAPGLFTACARRCLAPSASMRPVVEQRSGLAVVGTRLRVAGKPIGAGRPRALRTSHLEPSLERHQVHPRGRPY